MFSQSLDMPTDPFYGESKCQKPHCTNNAYWKCSNKFYCGMHGSKKTRIPLVKNPNAAESRAQREQEREQAVLRAMKQNQENKKEGDVICTKLRMMKTPQYVEGFRRIYPNFRHENKKDGFGCKNLSPMSLGPVVHNQPGLPDALNIENYHQGNKCFPWECEGFSTDPGPDFYEMQRQFYLDPVPHRHKFAREYVKDMDLENINVPVFSVHFTTKGEEKHFTYVQSRYFYCKQYEKLAKLTEEFQTLKRWKQEGVNLQIIGYDAYPVTMSLDEHYKDATVPFGHELVLYTLLVVNDPAQYPWNKFREQHPEVYRDIA